jgi:hypothetical protein
MILAGDIVTLKDCEPLDQILRKWKKSSPLEVHPRTRTFRIFN